MSYGDGATEGDELILREAVLHDVDSLVYPLHVPLDIPLRGIDAVEGGSRRTGASLTEIDR